MVAADGGAMRSEGGPRSAVLLLRVWQDQPGGSVRARLLEGGGADVDQRTVATVAGTEGILRAVARWLETFSAAR
jgi:hypothetical protein